MSHGQLQHAGRQGTSIIPQYILLLVGDDRMHLHTQPSFANYSCSLKVFLDCKTHLFVF